MTRTFVVKLEEREVPVENERQRMSLKERAAATMAAGYRVYRVDSAIAPTGGARGAAPVPAGAGARGGGVAGAVGVGGSRELTGRHEVKASMPGKVIHVLVQIGDAVQAKQGLLVIEAMKMENEIKSQSAGQVREIHVQPGQAVESGEILVVLE